MISALYNWLKNKDKDLAMGLGFGLALGLIVGLVYGLAYRLGFGLAMGLGFGLALGLIVGLVYGLAYGLAFGLATGFAWGLAWGLAYGLGSGIINISTSYPQSIPIWLAVLIVITTIELLFWLDRTTPKKNKNIIWFTCKRKAEALFGALLILVNINNIRYLLVTYKPDIKQYILEIIKWIGYIGIGIVCLVVIVGLCYGYIYLNSLKYNDKIRKVR